MEDVAIAVFVRLVGVVAIKYCVHETADCPDDRYRSVLQRNQLRKPTRLEKARHNDHIRSRIDEMRELLGETQLEMHVWIVIQVLVEMPEVTADCRVG